MKRKGAGEVGEVLTAVVLAAALIFMAYQIPKMIQDIAALLTVASAEATARDLAGLITISGAAQDKATIIYEGASTQIFYDITIKDRMVNIGDIRKGIGATGEKIKSAESPIRTGWGKTAVDPSGEFEGVRVFTIEKSRSDSCDASKVCDVYKISAWEENPFE